jgi:hypothetical protein
MVCMALKPQIQQRLKLLLVVWGLDNGRCNDQQIAFGPHGLSFIALLEAAARNRHDAGLFIRQIDLIGRPRTFSRRCGRLAPGLLAINFFFGLTRAHLRFIVSLLTLKTLL